MTTIRAAAKSFLIPTILDREEMPSGTLSRRSCKEKSESCSYRSRYSRRYVTYASERTSPGISKIRSCLDKGIAAVIRSAATS